jgi:peptide-methionine (S)-S-oxide reductase
MSETATLGGGCFWCLEAALRQLAGVESVTSGYCGGTLDHPTYAEVCSGDSGHAEVVQVRFDPAVIDYRSLLTGYFAIHDPTTKDRQGHDIGSQYRSVIFTHSAAQAATAVELIDDFTAQRLWPAPIVTEVRPSPRFWPAEESHQDYLLRNPDAPYCIAVVAPKAAKLRQLFSSQLKGRSASGSGDG